LYLVALVVVALDLMAQSPQVVRLTAALEIRRRRLVAAAVVAVLIKTEMAGMAVLDSSEAAEAAEVLFIGRQGAMHLELAAQAAAATSSSSRSKENQ
jgi:hypothetical protein